MLTKHVLCNKKKNIFLTFIVFFVSIFGMKIFKIIDVSIILNVIIIIRYACSNDLKIKLEHGKLILIMGVIITYSIIITLITQNVNTIFVLKFIRIFIAVIGNSCFVEKSKLKRTDLINILINVLLLHAITVIIEATIWVDLQNILKFFSGFERNPKQYRATGFVMGYDGSGLLCIFGLLFVGFEENSFIKNKYIKIIIFMIASYLTSRGTMIVMEIVLFLIFIKRGSNKKIKYFCFVNLILTIIPVIGVILVSTNNLDNLIVNYLNKKDFFREIFNNLVHYYAYSDVNDTINMHFSFECLSKIELIFGAMKQANKDPGYTQYIYNIGIFGTMFVMYFYVILLHYILKRKKNNMDEIVSYLYKIELIFIVLCIVLSLKNSYLLARHVTEIIIIMSCLLWKKDIKEKGYTENEFAKA